MRRAPFAAVAFAFLAAACAGNPEPGDDGYAYNVNGEYAAEFVTDDDGTAIYGTVTLATAPGGIVTGKMALTNPFTVDGEVEGLLFEDELTISIPYTIAENGCSGVTAGTGVVSEGGGSIVGHMDIADECGGPTGATFSLTLGN